MQLPQRLADRVGDGTDVALAAAFAVVIALDSRTVAAADEQWSFTLGTGLAICGLALLRRRHRYAAAVAGLAVFGTAGLVAALASLPAPAFTSGALAGLLALGASAIRRLPARQGALIALAGTMLIAATEADRAADTVAARTLFGLAGTMIWAAALALGGWLRYVDRRQQSAAEAVRRDERLDLARELHDVVAHHVTAIVVQAQAAGFVGQAHPEALTSALAAIESAGTDALGSMRRLVDLLRAPDQGWGLATAPEPLSDLVDRFATHGAAVELRAPAGIPDPAWPPEVTTTVYRIVQEALTNVARHAPDARSVTVTISHEQGRVTAEISNDAPGLAAQRPHLGSGYGLLGMRERVEALGGHFGAGPLPGTGWSVRASLPLGSRATR